MAYTYIHVTEGSGKKITTDQYTQGGDVLDTQVVKLAFGGAGAMEAMVSTGSGLPIDVRGNATMLTAQNTCSTAAYAAGRLLGAKMTFTSAARVAGGGGKIQSLVLTDLAMQSTPMDIVFMRANPVSTTFTDNTALTVNDNDLQNVVGHVPIAVADYAAFADNCVATVRNIGLRFKFASGADLYAFAVARSTPTYASSTDLKLMLNIEQD